MAKLDISSVKDLKGKTVAFLASGGLDSCTSVRWLTKEHGVKVVTFTADLGQPDEENIEDIKARMLACGADDAVMVPLQDELAEAGLITVQAQAAYEGGYWNTTGIARHVTTRGVVREMLKRGITILAHGATGRGNDQLRFQYSAHHLAPQIGVYAPWRDQMYLDRFSGRAQMIEFCEAEGLPIRATADKPYSTDANFLGLTHEAGKLESLMTPANFVTPGMGVYPVDAPNEAEPFEIRFEKGRPVSVNGKKASVLDAFLTANKVAGRNGVGIGRHVVENRVVGVKGRGIYEQPGITLLGSCYEFLLQLVVDRRSRVFFDHISRAVAESVYGGRGFDLASQMQLSAITPITNLVTGTVRVNLYKGNVQYVAAKDLENALYDEDLTSMEEGLPEFHHGDSEGFTVVSGLICRVSARRGHDQNSGVCGPALKK